MKGESAKQNLRTKQNCRALYWKGKIQLPGNNIGI